MTFEQGWDLQTMLDSLNHTENKMTLAYVNQVLGELGRQTKIAFQQKDYEIAKKLIHRVLEIAPKLSNAWMDLGTANLRLGYYDEAYAHFKKALVLMGEDVNTNVYDGLTEVCYLMEKQEEQLQYGQLAIQSKKQLVQHEPKLTIPDGPPPKFNSQKSRENIISYSLFGHLPRYGESAVMNVDVAKEIFPEWTCRFYVDDSVPKNVIDRLRAGGAEVIEVDEKQKLLTGLYWRFFVMDDPNVKRFLIRDADSLLSYRERAAVDQWLESDFWFHTMHDNYSHTELILAGMWGGCTGVFQRLDDDILNFIQTGRYLNERVMDQHYLRYCVWPTIEQSLLSHDSQGYDLNSQPFPKQNKIAPHETEKWFHVGANEAFYKVKISIHHAPSESIVWILKDEKQQKICEYSYMTNGLLEFELYFPSSYAKKIALGRWMIETTPLSK